MGHRDIAGRPNGAGVIPSWQICPGAGGGGTPGGATGDWQTNAGSGIFGGFTPGTNVQAFITTPTSANLAAALTNETGTGVAVFSISPALTTPNLGTPSAITLTNGTGLPVSTGLTGMAAGVTSALMITPSTAGGMVLFNGALGTPSSGTLTNATGLPISTGVSGLGTGVASALSQTADTATGVVTGTGAGTLANKTIQPRVVTEADATSWTPNCSTSDISYQLNTQASGTLTVNTPTGCSPFDGQKLEMRLKSSNLQTFSWSSAYTGSSDLALPTQGSGASGTAKFDFMIWQWNGVSSKWNMLGKNFGFTN
jgi:hypothetical protein